MLPQTAMSGIEVYCIAPTAALLRHLRRMAALLGARVVLRTGPPRVQVFVSPTRPTLVLMAGDRVLAQAVGDLPSWELRSLLAAALRDQQAPTSSDQVAGAA
jgi:hypothetical protein